MSRHPSFSRQKPRPKRARLSWLVESIERLELRAVPAVITPFAVRFATNTKGDIVFAANTILTAPPSDPSTINAQAGTGPTINNNDFSMVQVDVDGDAETFDSSTATLSMPQGSTVLFAGLYWGASSSSVARTNVLLKLPGASMYTAVSGSLIGADPTDNYQSFANVTALVQAAGSGSYAVANIQADIGTNKEGGWGLVVAYGNPLATPRNLTVFDGFAIVNDAASTVSFNITGFQAPPTGIVNANVGAIAYEGDLGFTGDSISLNSTVLSNALNPADNFFNSTISRDGVQATAKTPNYVNQLGFDADIVAANGVIANNATTATVSLTTGGETYYPAVVTTAFDLYAPMIEVPKVVTNLTHPDGPVRAGDVLQYTLVVENTAGEAADNVVLEDAIPAGSTYVAGSLQSTFGAGPLVPQTDTAGDDTAEYDSANNRVAFRVGAGATSTTGGTLAIGQYSTIAFRVQINAGASSGTEVDNQAALTYVGALTGFGLATSSTVTTQVVREEADLGVTVTSNVAAPVPGNTVFLTVTLTDYGPSNATGVSVTDLLPAGLSFVSAVPSQGTYNSGTGVWTVGNVPNGSSLTLVIQATDVSSTFIDTAAISASGVYDPNPLNDSATLAANPQSADLAVTSTVDQSNPALGDTVTFTVTVTDNGPFGATGVSVLDPVPAGLNVESITPSAGTYDASTGVWTIGSITNGASRTLVIVAQVALPDTIQNAAVVLTSNQPDPAPGNNSAVATVITQRADLGVTAAVDNAAPNVGDVIHLTFTATNTGPFPVTEASVLAALPAGLTFVSALPSQGSYNATTGVWTVATLDTTVPRTLVVTVMVTAPNPATVTATISAPDQVDPNPENNSDSVTETPQQSDLTLTNTVDNSSPNVGGTVTFTVTLANNGPSTATNVTVLDLLPVGLTYVSATPSQGTYNSATGVWTVGSVIDEFPTTLLLTATVVSPLPRTDTASISHADQYDGNTENNSASATETPQQSDLALTNTVDNPTPNVGGTVTFTVTLANNGPSTATNVTVLDLLPAGLTYVSATPSQGTYNSATGVWTVGSVIDEFPTTLVITATVASPTATTDTASVTHSDQYDATVGNNSASVTVTPAQSDLAVTITVDHPTPNVGDTVAFTVTLRNNGPSTATNVTVNAPLPSGLTYVSATPGQGTYNQVTGAWTVGSLAGNGSTTLVVMATVISPLARTVTTSVAHSDVYDGTSGNNIASATETPQQAELGVLVTVDKPTANVGDTVIFTATLTDNGPNSATNVTVNELLPPGLTFVSAITGPGSYNPATGVWTVGTVNGSAPRTLEITATVAAPTANTVTATISHSDQYDGTAGNNSASVTQTLAQSDLRLTNTVDHPTPNVGDTVTFTVTLTNNGPDAATNVTVNDLLPAGLTLVAATPSQGAYNPTTGVWTVGTLAGSGSPTLVFTAIVASPSASTDTATIAHSDQFDGSTENNSASATETPQQSDLALTNTVNNPTPNVGDTVTFTATLTNNGPNTATNVTVNDLFPAGLTFVSATPAQGTYNSATGVWTVGNLGTELSTTLVLTASVASSSARTDTATVLHSDQFDATAGNNSASADETPQQSDLALTNSVNNPTPNVGDTVTFTATLTNNGPNTATNVTVNDLLPAGLAFVSATPAQGTYNSTTGVWTVGSLGTELSTTLILTATVVSPATRTDTASVFHSDQFDATAGNNSASATETPLQSDLALTNTVNNPTPNVGDTVTFTATLTNNGPNAATNVTVNDLLPAGLTLVSATPGQGTYNSTTGVWTVGSLAGSGSTTLVLTATVVSPTASTDTASILHADQYDGTAGNNSASATETPQQSDLGLTNTVDHPAPNVGDTVTFTATLTNSGPNTATNVTVNDLLPAGLTLVSATPGQGTYNSATGVWTVGSLANSGSTTLVLTAIVVSAAASTDTASVLHSDQFDPTAGNNSASATETPQQSDLALTNTVDHPAPNVSDTVTFTVTLTNNGPNVATSVTVTDLLPAGLTFVSATPGQGTYNSTIGVWTVGSLGTELSTTLLLTATVVSPSARTDTASVSHSDQFDATAGNNSASATETPQQSDLALTNTVDHPAPNVGDTVTFTATLTNNGPNAATNVTVNDLLPAGLTLVSATPGQGTYNSTTGVWTVGSLAGSGSTTLLLTATVVSPAASTDSASILHADQFDGTAGNNSASATETPLQSDLGLTNTVDRATPNVGDTVTFTATLTNSGPNAATNVTVNDLLPAGLTFVSATPGQGTYNSTNGVWTVGSLAGSGSTTLILTATVVSPAASTNTASILHSDQFDATAGNNTASATETPQQSDLALTNTVDHPAPNVGDTVTFTATLTNSGPNTATTVTVNDLLPAGLTFVSATPGQGTYNPITGVWTVGSLASSGSTTLLLTATVASPAARTDTASVLHSDQFDATAGNNSASATETPQQSDLALTNTVDHPAPNVGDTVTFTATLTNNGPNAATSVTVNDLLPAGLTLVSAIPGQGTYNPTTGVWTVGSLAGSGSTTLILTATVVSPAATTVTAAVLHSDQFDATAGNNSASATETPLQSDLGLTNTVDHPAPNVGDTVTFTATLTNHGPNAATTVTVNDLLPAGLTLVTATPGQGTYNSTTGVWTVGSLAGEGSTTLVLTATVTSPAATTNTASISHSDQFDATAGNNSASATETPLQSDLGLTNTVDQATPNVGDTVTFTATLTNHGPNTATNVTVNDLLPAGLTLVSASPGQGTYNPATGMWTVGSLAGNGSTTLLLTATVASPSARTDTASISHSDQFDGTAGNNSASATETPLQADLGLTNTVNHPTPNVGDTVTFTATLRNNGPNAATNVTVNDLLPAGLTFVSATPGQGTYNPINGVWTVGSLAGNGSTTLLLTATVVSPVASTDTASIFHSDQFDATAGNNSASATETPLQSDLGLTNTVNHPTPNVGDTVTFTATLTNHGPNAATSVTVNDLLPAGLTFISATPAQGTYNPATGLWTVGSLAVSGSTTLVLTATVSSPSASTDTALISHSDQFDATAGNNSASATETPLQSDLALTNTVNHPTPNVGDTVTFTATLTNNGPNTATSVTVNDLLPAGLTLVSATPGQGTYNSTTGVWTVGSLGSELSATLILTARVASPSASTDTASILHSDQFDATAGNNSASATVTPLQSDLGLTNTVDQATPNLGGTVTFTATLTNSGPNTATNVTVNDLLPAGLSLVSATPGQGTYNATTGVWTVGSLAGEGSTTLVLTATVVSPSSSTDTASIAHSDQFDGAAGNNSASATITPQQSDLGLTNTVNHPTPNVGDTVTFTTTLTNHGPNAATSVTVNDLLPAGLTLVSATPGQGTYDPATGVWTIGSLAASGATTLVLTATVVSPFASTDTASVAHSDQFDGTPGNNSASATETPRRSDLGLTYTVNNPAPNVGGTVTFTATLSNIGPDAATNVTVNDLLPVGLTLVSATPGQGTYNPNTGVWTAGSLAVGGSTTLVITATVASPSSITSTTSVAHSDQFDATAGNNSASATETPQQSDLGLTYTVDHPSPNVGDTVTFTATLTNNGPNAATNVTVNDLLPAGLTLVSASPGQGTYNPATGVWTAGNLAGGGTTTLVLTASVASPSSITSTTSVAHSDQFDGTPGNNSASATETPRQSDLGLTYTVDHPSPNVGETVTFTATLTNHGPDAATNVSVNDLLPAGLTPVSATPGQGTYNVNTGVWTAGSLVGGGTTTLVITASVVSPSSITSTASIAHSDQFDGTPGNNSASATETPQQSDLGLTYTVDHPSPIVGDTVTFTATLTNHGPNAATHVTVNDLLPAGLTLVSATPNQGTYDPTTGVWTAGSLAGGGSTTLVITATVASPSSITSTTSIAHSDQFDGTPGNNSASVTETPQQSDLGLTYAVDHPSPNVGDTVTFTATLTNHGPNAATSVTVNDLLPAGLTLVSATPGQGTYNLNTGVWTAGSLAGGGSTTLVITATIASPSSITSTTSIAHSDQFDGTPGNNSASVTETPQQSDLGLTYAVDHPSPNVGDTVTFTATLTNHGPNAATNVTVNDLLPAGLSLMSASPGQGTYNPATGVWTAGSLAGGGSTTLVITATVASPSSITSTTSVAHSDQFDGTPGNNSASVTETPQQSDLGLTYTVDNPSPNVGDTVTFTATLTNHGPNAATNVTVNDLLPAGLTLVSATPGQGTYNPITGVWTAGSVAGGGSTTLVITATVASPSSITSTASVAQTDQFDATPGNNSASVTETPQRSDLALAYTVDNPSPNVGDTVTFTATLTNHGPNAATNVTVNDLLPAGLTLVSATPGQGTYDPNTGVWTVGGVSGSGSTTLVIVATVASPSPSTSTTSIVHSDQFDGTPGNNSVSVTETPQQADLGLTLTVDRPNATLGTTVTFTATLTNHGPNAATNVTVNDLLPAGLSLVSTLPGQGTYDPSTGVWTVGTLAGSGTTTLILTATVASSSSSTLTTSVAHEDQFDATPGNNSASVTVNPQQSDLGLTLTVDKPNANVGATVTFTATLTNHGPDTATNVTVNDLLPAGLTLVSALPGQGTYDPSTGVWTVGSLAGSGTTTLILTETVTSPSASTSTVSVAQTDQFDATPGNNSASVTVTPQQSDLGLILTVDKTAPNVGDTVTFTATLSNNGPNAATSVTVNDLLPPGLTLVSAAPGQGTYEPGTGVWTVGSLAGSGATTLVITATVASSAAVTVPVSVAHSDQYDATPGNNSASATETPQRSDLELTLTVDKTSPNVGDTVTFTVTLTNNGPNAATNVTVNDLLPAGLTLVSATPGQGTYDPATGVWTVGTLASNGTTTLVITATVTTPSASTMTAVVAHSDQFDGTPGTNSMSATETPQRSDLGLTYTVDNPAPNVGDTVTFTATLTNSGPNTATNVTVNALLPAGLTLVSATPGQGTYNPNTGVWSVGSLGGGGTATLVLKAIVTSLAPSTLTATVAHSDQFNGTPGINVATTAVAPQQLARAPVPVTAAAITPTSLSGRVYVDLNHNGRFEPSEYGLAHIVVTLTGTDNLGRAVRLTRETGADGQFSFNGLEPGAYTLHATTPSVFRTGVTLAGTAGGTAADGGGLHINLAAGSATGYQLGMLTTPSCRLEQSVSRIRAFFNNLIHRGGSHAQVKGHLSPAATAALTRGTLPRSLAGLASGRNISYYVPTLNQIPADLAASTALKAQRQS